MQISKQTTIEELTQLPEFASMKGQFISSHEDYFAGDRVLLSPEALQQQNPTWNAEDMVYGLSRLREIAREYAQYVFPVYTDEEIDKDPCLAQVKLIWMPAQHKKSDTYAVLTAGGAYGAVCTMGEALPVAARLNSLGMDCFCLNYRTARPDSFVKGLLPQPLDDLAAALRFIKYSEKAFDITAEKYIVGGFSAGGHLCAMWGTSDLGFAKYGLPAPQMLIPVYPMVTMENYPDGAVKDYMCRGMFGADYTQEDIRRYAVHRHIDGTYPKSYLVQCEDDRTVSVDNTRMLGQALRTAGVHVRLDIGKTGGHGFGLGTATDVAGWVDRALDFMKED